jgi:hypothetical protein
MSLMADLRAGAAPILEVPSPSIRLSPPVQHVACILLVAAAIKLPLGVPLYLNGLLLALGLFAALAVQAVQPILLWPALLLGLGVLGAASAGVLPSAGPRLGQVALILLATSLLARIEPRLFARYLILLLPLALLVLLVEPLLPDALYRPRRLFGLSLPRAAGLHGEHNYNAMMMGAVGAMLAQHRPKLFACVPFAVALTAISRGFLVAFLAWLGAKAVGRHAAWLICLGLIVLFSQPLIVLSIEQAASPLLLDQLDRLTSSRFPLWLAYADMGLSSPLGVGYWQGPPALAQFDPSFIGKPGKDAHSIYLQVFGEFGWLGYLVFAGFVGHVTLVVRRHAPDYLPVLLFVMTGYAFYDGLSDWAFWVPIGYVLAAARQGVEGPEARAGAAT